MKNIDRRSFLKTSALAAAAFSMPARSWSQVEGSNSDVRFAVIGFNGRGKDHMQTIGEVKGARITALCDADENVLSSGVAQFRKDGKEIFIVSRLLIDGCRLGIWFLKEMCVD